MGCLRLVSSLSSLILPSLCVCLSISKTLAEKTKRVWGPDSVGNNLAHESQICPATVRMVFWMNKPFTDFSNVYHHQSLVVYYLCNCSLVSIQDKSGQDHKASTKGCLSCSSPVSENTLCHFINLHKPNKTQQTFMKTWLKMNITKEQRLVVIM